MSTPDKYEEAFERWFGEARQLRPLPDTSTVRWIRHAFLAGWKEGLRDASGIFDKKVCPACGATHYTATEHCPSCKQAIDSGDKPCR